MFRLSAAPFPALPVESNTSRQGWRRGGGEKNAWTGKSTMMIFPSKVSSGFTVVSVEKSFLRGRVMKGLTSMEKLSVMMLRVRWEKLGNSCSQYARQSSKSARVSSSAFF